MSTTAWKPPKNKFRSNNSFLFAENYERCQQKLYSLSEVESSSFETERVEEVPSSKKSTPKFSAVQSSSNVSKLVFSINF